jgi:hypothetical protein
MELHLISVGLGTVSTLLDLVEVIISHTGITWTFSRSIITKLQLFTLQKIVTKLQYLTLELSQNYNFTHYERLSPNYNFSHYKRCLPNYNVSHYKIWSPTTTFYTTKDCHQPTMSHTLQKTVTICNVSHHKDFFCIFL